jgi:hypothetical protein
MRTSIYSGLETDVCVLERKAVSGYGPILLCTAQKGNSWGYHIKCFMLCGEHDNFILKAFPEMSEGPGVSNEGRYRS